MSSLKRPESLACKPEQNSVSDSPLHFGATGWGMKASGTVWAGSPRGQSIEGLSHTPKRLVVLGSTRASVRKMLSYSVPPGYVRTRPPVRPKLDPFIGIIDRILEEDKDRPKKQRHTSKRIFERLRDEYGFTGKITMV